ncbi:hypothetical protein BLNAU_23622 [Blattamonas nauphoetae]|uniref:Uncharacterized protein n=1 Tax=Blattamonas nauphoetae TaxID=2049346 RepID=A0ABQ9WPR9_9EUKA|nr:hypothetical protein BLNAU_23622 [Blattamonas nauphoetae]
MKILITSLWLQTPFGLQYLGMKGGDEQQTIREMIFQRVLTPSEKQEPANVSNCFQLLLDNTLFARDPCGHWHHLMVCPTDWDSLAEEPSKNLRRLDRDRAVHFDHPDSLIVPSTIPLAAVCALPIFLTWPGLNLRIGHVDRSFCCDRIRME